MENSSGLEGSEIDVVANVDWLQYRAEHTLFIKHRLSRPDLFRFEDRTQSTYAVQTNLTHSNYTDRVWRRHDACV